MNSPNKRLKSDDWPTQEELNKIFLDALCSGATDGKLFSYVSSCSNYTPSRPESVENIIDDIEDNPYETTGKRKRSSLDQLAQQAENITSNSPQVHSINSITAVHHEQFDTKSAIPDTFTQVVSHGNTVTSDMNDNSNNDHVPLTDDEPELFAAQVIDQEDDVTNSTEEGQYKGGDDMEIMSSLESGKIPSDYVMESGELDDYYTEDLNNTMDETALDQPYTYESVKNTLALEESEDDEVDELESSIEDEQEDSLIVDNEADELFANTEEHIEEEISLTVEEESITIEENSFTIKEQTITVEKEYAHVDNEDSVLIEKKNISTDSLSTIGSEPIDKSLVIEFDPLPSVNSVSIQTDINNNVHTKAHDLINAQFKPSSTEITEAVQQHMAMFSVESEAFLAEPNNDTENEEDMLPILEPELIPTNTNDNEVNEVEKSPSLEPVSNPNETIDNADCESHIIPNAQFESTSAAINEHEDTNYNKSPSAVRLEPVSTQTTVNADGEADAIPKRLLEQTATEIVENVDTDHNQSTSPALIETFVNNNDEANLIPNAELDPITVELNPYIAENYYPLKSPESALSERTASMDNEEDMPPIVESQPVTEKPTKNVDRDLIELPSFDFDLISDAAIENKSNESGDEDRFFDVEYEDIDEEGNFTAGAERSTAESSSLDLCKGTINDSQIAKEYQALEAKEVETGVQNTQIKDLPDMMDIYLTTNTPMNEKQVETDAEDKNMDDDVGFQDSLSILEDEVMEEAYQPIIDLTDSLPKNDMMIAEETEDAGDLEEKPESLNDSEVEDIQEDKEDGYMESIDYEELLGIAVDLEKEAEQESVIDLDDDYELSIDSEDDEDEEELPSSLPESLPLPHIDTQITPVTWRDEDAKLVNTYQLPTSRNLNRTTTELKDVLDENNSLKMWWYDAIEEGKKTLFFFGKVFNATLDKYVSCCVAVENIQRELFILPRNLKLDENGDLTKEAVTLDDVEAELCERLTKKGITHWSMDRCVKKYAFELPDIPREASYIKLNYSYNDYKFPEGTNGQTFSHMFGTSVDVMENFIIQHKIMGPCWLEFKNVSKTQNKESWCIVEAVITDPDDCSVLQHSQLPPPLTIMSLSLQTEMNFNNHENEILALSGFVCPNADIDHQETAVSHPYHRFSIIRSLPGAAYSLNQERPTFILIEQNTEEALLNAFLAKFQLIDPDIIVGHNFTSVDLDILLHRMKKLNIFNWSRIGRRRRNKWPRLQAGAGGHGETHYEEQMIMSGRLICDTFVASQDLVRSKSYHLSELAFSQLNIVREGFGSREIEVHKSSGTLYTEMARHCAFDAYLSYSLMVKLQILPLTKQLTNLSGNLWTRSMNGARSERNEYLLLHTFSEQNYICPDRPSRKKKNSELIFANNQLELESSFHTSNSEKTTSFAGGLVLEPKSGFYDEYVLLLDFNSLYPSIMQEYNVCFTTIKRKSEGAKDYDVREIPEIPSADCPEGILPSLVRMFVQRRQHVKQLMKDPEISKSVKMQYDIEQMALKLTANSMYGCLGSSISRFYARSLAMLITHKGREILRSTVDLAEKLGYNVIYGDTDSIMINTNETKMSKVRKIGEKLKKHVNEKYDLLEIDVDGYFRHTLLLKKKKYAALVVKSKPQGGLEEFVEVKGLDLVRRDWCDLSHTVSEYVLKLILSDKSREIVVDDIHNYLRDITQRIHQNEFDLNEFIIRKQLTKNPEDYKRGLSLPHVHVAKEMRRLGITVKSGDMIPYVICSSTNESGEPFNEPCVPDLVRKDNVILDIEWYLRKQILPPVDRLCAPIKGIDLDSLANCLGLVKENIIKKAKKSNTKISQIDKENDPDLPVITKDGRFIGTRPLYLECNFCHHNNKYTGPLKTFGDDNAIPGLSCDYCRQSLNPANVYISVKLEIINYIRKYYDSGYVCEQIECGYSTTFTSLNSDSCTLCSGRLVREFSSKMLYTQLSELSSLFDISRIQWDTVSSQIKDAVELKIQENDTYNNVKKMIDEYIALSAFTYISIPNILQFN